MKERESDYFKQKIKISNLCAWVAIIMPKIAFQNNVVYAKKA